MSKQLDRAKAAGRVIAATRPSVTLFCAIHDAFDRIKTGEFGEPASVDCLTLEQFEGQAGPAPIKVYVAAYEEAIDHTPDQARELAYNLLAMAEISEAFFDQAGDES
jgi:hypothetical protein